MGSGSLGCLCGRCGETEGATQQATRSSSVMNREYRNRSDPGQVWKTGDNASVQTETERVSPVRWGHHQLHCCWPGQHASQTPAACCCVGTDRRHHQLQCRQPPRTMRPMRPTHSCRQHICNCPGAGHQHNPTITSTPATCTLTRASITAALLLQNTITRVCSLPDNTAKPPSRRLPQRHHRRLLHRQPAACAQGGPPCCALPP